MAEKAEWQNGRTAEKAERQNGRKGRTAEKAEWRKRLKMIKGKLKSPIADLGARLG